ncbi:MAG: Universal stress protein family, partial [uncultured Rubrobacteraceae bacterium]
DHPTDQDPAGNRRHAGGHTRGEGGDGHLQQDGRGVARGPRLDARAAPAVPGTGVRRPPPLGEGGSRKAPQKAGVGRAGWRGKGRGGASLRRPAGGGNTRSRRGAWGRPRRRRQPPGGAGEAPDHRQRLRGRGAPGLVPGAHRARREVARGQGPGRRRWIRTVEEGRRPRRRDRRPLWGRSRRRPGIRASSRTGGRLGRPGPPRTRRGAPAKPAGPERAGGATRGDRTLPAEDQARKVQGGFRHRPGGRGRRRGADALRARQPRARRSRAGGAGQRLDRGAEEGRRARARRAVPRVPGALHEKGRHAGAASWQEAIPRTFYPRGGPTHPPRSQRV